MKSVYTAAVFVFFAFSTIWEGASGSMFPFENHSFVTSFIFCLVCECEKHHKKSRVGQTKDKRSHKTMNFELREHRTASPSQFGNAKKTKTAAVWTDFIINIYQSFININIPILLDSLIPIILCVCDHSKERTLFHRMLRKRGHFLFFWRASLFLFFVLLLCVLFVVLVSVCACLCVAKWKRGRKGRV